MAHHRATRAEINLKAFKHNLQNLKKILGPNTGIMAIIKADAYGHGAIPCAKAALECGVQYLGAGVIQEGIELRKNGITDPILILGSIFLDESADLVHHDLATIVCTTSLAEELSKQGKKQGKIVKVHIKVNTGMNRLGVRPEDLSALVEKIETLPNLKLEGLSTHFSSADDEDTSITKDQIEIFQKTLVVFQKLGIHLPITHLANSSALLRFPESRGEIVRPGLILYGALPSPGLHPIVKEACKKENLQNTKKLITKLQNVKLASKVIKTLSKRYEKRKGGYTRIIKSGFRYGDNAPMAVIEFVDRDIEAKKVDKKKKDPTKTIKEEKKVATA